MKTGFTQPSPSIRGAARGNFRDAQAVIESHDARLSALEKKVAGGTFNSQGAPVASPPPLSNLAVSSPMAGQMVVAITNPQYIPGSKPGTARGNAQATAIVHQIDYSPAPDFSRNVVSLPPSTQNHYAIPVSGTFYVRLRSSFDGHNFNTPQVSKPVTA